MLGHRSDILLEIVLMEAVMYSENYGSAVIFREGVERKTPIHVS